MQTVNGDSDLSIPIVFEGEEEGRLFSEDVKSDTTLAKQREKADKGLDGYRWDDGLLNHGVKDSLGNSVIRLVVPKSRRPHTSGST